MGSGNKKKKQASNTEYITGTLRLGPEQTFTAEGVKFQVTGTRFDEDLKKYTCSVKNLEKKTHKDVDWDKLYAILEQLYRQSQGGGNPSKVVAPLVPTPTLF